MIKVKCQSIKHSQLNRPKSNDDGAFTKDEKGHTIWEIVPQWSFTFEVYSSRYLNHGALNYTTTNPDEAEGFKVGGMYTLSLCDIPSS